MVIMPFVMYGKQMHPEEISLEMLYMEIPSVNIYDHPQGTYHSLQIGNPTTY